MYKKHTVQIYMYTESTGYVNQFSPPLLPIVSILVIIPFMCVCVYVCVCVCVCVPSRVVPPRGWGQATSHTAKSTRAVLDCCVLRTGCHLAHTKAVPLQRICNPLSAENNLLHKEQDAFAAILARGTCILWWTQKVQ